VFVRCETGIVPQAASAALQLDVAADDLGYVNPRLQG
jgi:hypothetical protein